MVEVDDNNDADAYVDDDDEIGATWSVIEDEDDVAGNDEGAAKVDAGDDTEVDNARGAGNENDGDDAVREFNTKAGAD